MHLQGYWGEFMANAGNEPGAQRGDVIITLAQPVGGVKEVTVPSAAVTLAAEAGNLIGLQVVLPDRRHLFVAAAYLVGIIDAPPASDGPKAVRPARKAGSPD
jgi:hypothetical protein